ncbi:MAG: hypothetical protein Q9218_002902 [Villophora microphyllina]
MSKARDHHATSLRHTLRRHICAPDSMLLRARSRKTRCDPGLPKCGTLTALIHQFNTRIQLTHSTGPCERNSAVCEYFDSSKGQKVSRNYVIHLQQKIKALEAQYDQVEHDCTPTPAPDVEGMVRSGGLVTLKENAETRYLGPSSGIAMTRLVMEIAKRQTQSTSIQDIISDSKARRNRDRFTLESAKPTSKVYPLVSDVAAPDLPSRHLTDNLVDLFNRKAQFMLPTLHEPSFGYTVDNVYNGSTDAYENFVLRMVLSVSMQKLDTQYAGLADSYYLAAMPYLEKAIQRKDVGTLQCLALIAQYSIITPTRAASYWVVGLASKLCQELGLTEEATIERPDRTGRAPDALEIDMRRRLFWIIFSMETGLAHSLGRPSAIACSFDHVDISFFRPIDDEYITKEGVGLGCPHSMKKRVAIHFLSMRLLQLEIRRTLYMKKRPNPANDQDPWFSLMKQKLDNWLDFRPREDGGSGLDQVWFKGRYNTMIVFLYRPSPQVPNPSLAAARACFEASIYNVRMHRNQVATKSVDLSWIWTQSLFMALNTILWAISFPEIRQEHSKSVVENHIMQAQECIAAASERWPGVEAAMELYDSLISACLKAYDEPKIASVSDELHLNEASPLSLERNMSQPLASSPSTMDSSFGSPQPSEYTATPPSAFAAPHRMPITASIMHKSSDPETLGTVIAQHSVEAESIKLSDSEFLASHPSQSTAYDPKKAYSLGLPISNTHQPQQTDIAMPLTEFDPYFALMGDPYFQYSQVPDLYQSTLPGLNQEQQFELMESLESDSATYSWRFP